MKDFRCKKEYGLSHSIFCILHGWSKLNKKNVKFNHTDKFDMYKFRHLLCPEYDILIFIFLKRQLIQLIKYQNINLMRFKEPTVFKKRKL